MVAPRGPGERDLYTRSSNVVEWRGQGPTRAAHSITSTRVEKTSSPPLLSIGSGPAQQQLEVEGVGVLFEYCWSGTGMPGLTGSRGRQYLAGCLAAQ